MCADVRADTAVVDFTCTDMCADTCADTAVVDFMCRRACTDMCADARADTHRHVYMQMTVQTQVYACLVNT